jgi:hypothetical protein
MSSRFKVQTPSTGVMTMSIRTDLGEMGDAQIGDVEY